MAELVGSGKGSRVYDRGGRRWKAFTAWVEYERDPETGKRRRERREFKRAGDRDAWLTETIAKAANEDLIARTRRAAGGPTVGELLDRYVEHGRLVAHWAPVHLRRTKQVTTKDLAPLRQYRALKLAPRTIEAFLADRHAGGASPNTCRLARVALSAAYNLAIRDRLLPFGANPVAFAKGPRIPKLPPGFLKEDEARLFLEACRSHHYGTLYLVATVCALRPGEVLGLHWDDIDWSSETITIRRNVQYSEGEYSIREPKADSRRAIPVPRELLDALEAYRDGKVKTRAHKRRVKSVVVFPNTSGGYLHEPRVRRDLAKLLADAELPSVTLYELRHTGATLMLAMRVPLERISEIMGHSSINVTRRYAQITEPLRRDVADRMGTFLGSVGRTQGRTETESRAT